MGFLIASVLFFLYALNIIKYDNYSPNSDTARLITFCISLICLYWAFTESPYLSRLLRRYTAWRDNIAHDREIRNAERAIAREWRRTKFTLPTPEEFRAIVEQQTGTYFHRAFRLNVLYYQQDLYVRTRLLDKTLPVEQSKRLYDVFLFACIKGLADLSMALPQLREETADSPFTVEQHFTPDELAPAYYELAAPMNNAELKQHLFKYQDFTFAPPPDHPGTLIDRYKSHLHDDKPPSPEKIKRQWEKEKKDYDKQTEKVQSMLYPMQRALQGTPYWDYADRLIPREAIHEPFIFPFNTRFAGTWVIAPPGRGKTNLLHNLIAEDRKTGTVVLMDSKGDLINAYRGLPDVVVIDAHNVQINPFQLGSSTRTIDFLEYIFSALLETKLTPKQTTLFRCVLALMLKIPDATVETFRKLLVHGWKEYEPAVMSLDETNRDFFYVEGRKSEFDGGQYNETKQEVLQRLRLLLSNDYLKQIFTAPQSNIHFSALLDSGSTIIIDNSKDDLGENGAEFFGRFFVALVWMAAVSRSRQRQEDKVPVYFYIDEAHTVIRRDTKITTILDECRSQKIALVLAHQRIGQIEPNVIDALNNCAIRLTNSDDDAEQLAKRFRVDAEVLRLPIGQFACFVRDKTVQAVTINVPLFDTSIFPAAPPRPHYAPTPEPTPAAPEPKPVPTDEVEDF